MAVIEQRTLTGTTPCLPIDLKDSTILRVELPSVWTTSTIAIYEAFGATDAYKLLYDDENVQITLAGDTGNRMVRVDERLFQHARLVKFSSVIAQSVPAIIHVQVVRLTELAYGSPS